MQPQRESEQWPNPDVPYEYPQKTAENAGIWKRAIDEARKSGSLRLEKSGKYYHNLVGTCPRCGHEMGQQLQFGGVIGVWPQKRTGTFNIRCDCNEDTHEGRDAGRRGCGWGGPNAVNLRAE